MLLPFVRATDILLISFAYVAIYLSIKLASRKRPRLPPGPPAEPVIGHLRSIPQTNLDATFYEWGKIYGDVIYLHVLGRSIVVLNSVQAALDLLDKRSSNYSDRPKFVIFELMGWLPTITFLRYGERFRTHRRLFQYLRRNNIASFHDIQTQEARILAKNLSSGSGAHDGVLHRFAENIVMRVAYGHQITSDEDQYLKLAKDSAYALSHAGSPGNTPVDIVPFLQYLPSWFPGAYYASFARKWRATIRKFHEFPCEDVQKQMTEGTAEPSFLASMLEDLSMNGSSNGASLDDIQGAAGAIYTGGKDTTWSTLSIFLLAMVLNPACQKEAQKELDDVIRNDRLPEFSDRDSLPYIECLLQETLRWNSAVPLGIPHCSMEDDVYRGMFIPAGSLIIANTRGMALDESIYLDPLSFNPSRFLPRPIGNGEPWLPAVFGFGRRVCPGRYLADASLWIAVVTILSTLTISKAVDSNGEEIDPEISFTTTTTSHPTPYECRIQPRFAKSQ